MVKTISYPPTPNSSCFWRNITPCFSGHLDWRLDSAACLYTWRDVISSYKWCLQLPKCVLNMRRCNFLLSSDGNAEIMTGEALDRLLSNLGNQDQEERTTKWKELESLAPGVPALSHMPASVTLGEKLSSFLCKPLVFWVWSLTGRPPLQLTRERMGKIQCLSRTYARGSVLFIISLFHFKSYYKPMKQI